MKLGLKLALAFFLWLVFVSSCGSAHQQDLAPPDAYTGASPVASEDMKKPGVGAHAKPNTDPAADAGISSQADAGAQPTASPVPDAGMDEQ